MSADNYALVGPHPLAGIGDRPKDAHGVIVAFMSSDYKPTVIPEGADWFPTKADAVGFAQSLGTEYGVVFLTDHAEVDDENKEPQLAEWEKELLYPATKKTVRQVVRKYSDKLYAIYTNRTAGDFTWLGLLHEFMDEIASTEDEC